MTEFGPRPTLPDLKRLLVVQTAYLGDVIMTTPLLRVLRRSFPHAEITLFARAAGAALVAGQDVIDRCVGIDKGATPIAFGGRLEQLRRAARGGFDAVFCAQRSIHSGLIALASRAPIRIGFVGAPGAFAYTDVVDVPRTIAAPGRYVALAGAVGAMAGRGDVEPRLLPTAEARRRVDSLLAVAGIARDAPLLVLAPGSVRKTKRWPASRFAEVARGAIGRGLVPVVVGAADERELESRIISDCGPGSVGLVGRTTIAELVAIAARACAVVANDSGPAHVAAAVGASTLVVFGPTGSRQGLAPVGAHVRYLEHPALACRPCDRRGPRRCPERHFRCMTELTGRAALEALEALGVFDGSAGRSGSVRAIGRQTVDQDPHRAGQATALQHVS